MNLISRKTESSKNREFDRIMKGLVGSDLEQSRLDSHEDRERNAQNAQY